MSERCSFCEKSRADAEHFIAGPSVFICDECVRACARALGFVPGRWRYLRLRRSTGETSAGFAPQDESQFLIRVPDGNVVAGRAITWTPFAVAGETLEWCAARAIERGIEPLVLVVVRRPGDDRPAVGAALSRDGRPTKRRAREAALRYLLKTDR
jgi:hypothetical protein